MKKILSIALSMVILLGCAGIKAPLNYAGKQMEEAPVAVPEDKAGKENKIVFAIDNEVEELDPTLNTYSRSAIVLHNLFKGLYKLDSTNIPVPAYAAGYSIDDTGTKYVFTLKSGAKWSNGSPLTAYDFEYSWKRTANPEVASKVANEMFLIKNAKAYFEGDATAEDMKVKAVDSLTLEVELEAPAPYFLYTVSSVTYCPVKKELVEAGDGWKSNADEYVSTGPFMLKEIKPKEKLVMAKNPNYIDADKVEIDMLEMIYINSQEEHLTAYINNEIDISNLVGIEALEMFEGSKELQLTDRFGMYYLDINCSVKPYGDPRVRRALSMAIDREFIVNEVIKEPNKAAFGVVPNGIPDIANPSYDYRDTVGNIIKEDIGEAKRLLEEAGYPDGKDFPVMNFMTMDLQPQKDIAQAILSMWKENLGIESELNVYESKIYWEEQEAGNFHVMRDSWTGGYPDPMSMLAIFEEGKQYYQTRWKNDEFTGLLQANRKTGDQQLRMKNFIRGEQILVDEAPVIPIYFMTGKLLCKPHIKGVYKNYVGHVYFEYASIED